MKISMIVPVFYGEPQLGQALSALDELRSTLDIEIVVVVDVPDPAREAEARASNHAVAGPHSAVEVYRIGERGFGSALRRGFAEATGDVVIPFMADVSDDLSAIPRMVYGIEGGADVVAASRYMKGGRIVGNTMKQRVSKWYSVLVRLFGGPPIHDVSNAFKAYRKTVVDSVAVTSTSFDLSVELTVKAFLAGFRIAEVPATWTNRTEGKSKFKMGEEIPNYGRWLLLAARSRRRLSPAPAAGSQRAA